MKRPTDIELMAYADGELDEADRRRVEAWLTHDSDARAQVDATRALGNIVRASTDRGQAFDITDSLFAALDAEPAPAREQAPEPARHLQPQLRLAPPLATQPPSSRRAPAPRRGPLEILATFAAAASLLLYMNHAAERPQDEAAQGNSPAATVVASAAQLGINDDDVVLEDGTEIDSIDFGVHRGAVFFVKGLAHSSTAVVWIDDEDPSP